MPKIIDHDEQRARIRQAALEVLARDGTLGGLGHIAAQTGMKRANLYTYYLDRQALIDDVAKSLLDAEEQIFADMLNSEGNATEKILHLVDSICERFSEWSQMGGAILQIWARNPERIRELLHSLRKTLTQTIEIAQSDGLASRKHPARHSATLVIALIDGLMLQLFLDPDNVPGADEMHPVIFDTIRTLVGIDTQEGVIKPKGHTDE